jgi:hypothetical protein
MRHLEGFGDTLEDDVEHMHQISARIEAGVSWMKNKDRQAFVHSKMEAIQLHAAVTEKFVRESLWQHDVLKSEIWSYVHLQEL